MDTTTETKAAPAAADTANAAPPARRAKGVLDAEILAYMQTRPADQLGPYEIAKAIGARTGGVHPALERLLAKGLVTKPQTEKPVRYRLAKATPRRRTGKAAAAS